MTDLFGNNNGAQFSECRKYRYALWRIWNDDLPKVMFIGLNPSVANESTNDPTIRRVIKFANKWGFGGIYMLNLFAYITSYPVNLLKCDNPIADNDRYLQMYADASEKIVFAWGSFKEAEKRARKVSNMFPDSYALVINKDGSPRHPLYVKGDVIPIKF